MKIHSEQLRALQDAEARRIKPHKTDEEFSALLTRQLDPDLIQASAAPEHTAAPATGLRSLPLAGLAENSALACAETAVEQASGHMEKLLGSFERYTRELALDERADLRQAYGLLEDMNGRIAEFSSRFPDLSAEQPALAAIINELDVLVSTETFKFNRGDYV
jgi:hypothetical protein